ncbi:MAG: hypothetical protein A2579_06585 [Lysobacterales bacterium RIFOXYD1_FULL_69_11]|nr:MAG: hypothetical protein A2579_06585 [Xanthomonadales bacterium RIFOXYD1_FULL_69_11]
MSPSPAAQATPHLDAAGIDAAIARLEEDMPDLQHRHRGLFAYAAAWAERHDAILRATPPDLREATEQRLRRIGIRWGVADGVRMTGQFPALKLGG